MKRGRPVAGIHLGILGRPSSFIPYSDGIRFGSRATFPCSPHSLQLLQPCQPPRLFQLGWLAWLLRLCQLAWLLQLCQLAWLLQLCRPARLLRFFQPCWFARLLDKCRASNRELLIEPVGRPCRFVHGSNVSWLFFFTPWGVGAMAIFLIANILLSLNQWLTTTPPTPRKAENSLLGQRKNNSRHLDRPSLSSCGGLKCG